MKQRTSFASFFSDDEDLSASLIERLIVDSVAGENPSEREARFVRERHEAAERIKTLEEKVHELQGKLRNLD